MSEYRIVKHRGNFSLAYNDPERGRIRLALGTSDRGLAEARASELWRARSRPPGDKVADIWAEYVAERKRDGIEIDPSESTFKALRSSFGHKIGTEVTREDCREHYRKRKRANRSDSTIRKEIEMLRAALRLRYGNAAPALWMPPPSKPRDRYLTKAEFEKLLANVETPHVRLYVILAVATGARMSALLELTWDRVDLKRKIIDLNPGGREQSNKRRAVVPINSRAMAALEEAREAAMSDHVIEYAGAPVKSVKKAIQAAARRANVPCSPHVFRHTAGVWMAEASMPMSVISQYLGHTSSRVTETTYARYSPDFLKGAAAALEW